MTRVIMKSVARRTLLGVPLGLAGLAALAACGAGGSSAGPQATATPPSASSPAAGSSVPSAAAPTYADGEYQARGTYGGGPSYIDVDLTLQDSRITAVDVTPLAENSTSLGYQRDFAGAVPDAVVGRPIDGLEVGRLAGSSTTPDGFNDALDQIRSQAAR